ncbi:MAG: hypothetical protein K0S11_1686 [Gammaproteobacteria bacterium]|jgi:transcriptional regulator with XRE-family HTH domain|nr:hypothetical protein [Gammaproteobacteria bacterium]
MGKRIKVSVEQSKQRAERIRYLRKLVDISREKFAKKHNIAPGSLQNWEDARYGGLTESGACQLAPAFQAEGIISCTIEWLLYGQGDKPTMSNFLDKFLAQPTVKPDEAMLVEELQVFSKLHPNSIDIRVTDDGLAPFFMLGDHVAGEKLFNDDIQKAIGYACIVQTQAGSILIRKVEMGSQVGCYNLICTNPDTTIGNPIETNIQLFSAAPIIWIRKPRIT